MDKNSEGAQHRRLLLPTLWAILIFFTSCFYISSQSWIHFVQHFLPPASRECFAPFWNAYALFFVKGWHFTEYAILSTLLYTGLRSRLALPPKRACLIAWLSCVLYAASDEWHQTFVPPRDGCLRDVLIDTAGASLAALLLVSRERRQISIKEEAKQ